MLINKKKNNIVFCAKIEHIELNFDFVRDQVCSKQLVTQFLSSRVQLANALTKPLPAIKTQTSAKQS